MSWTNLAGTPIHPMAMREKVGFDHTLAAMTASLRERVIQENADAAGLTVADYLRVTRTLPCTDYKPRRAMDYMEIDYMTAAIIATQRQHSREAEENDDEAMAIQAGLTVEEYELMKSDGSWPPRNSGVLV